MQPTQLPDALAAHLRAVNAHDTDAIMATLAPDSFVNDNRREFVGTEAIRGFFEREIVADNVTFEVGDVFEEHGDTIVRLITDGNYDKTGLPDPLILTGYVHLGESGIERMIIMLNQDAPA